MRREADFRAFGVRRDERDRLAKSLGRLEKLPVRAMTRLGWIAPTSDRVELLRRSCATAGVVLLFVPELPKTRVSGAARWLATHPVIQLSLRYKTDDQLWFTVLHEAAHVLLHSRGQTYVDEDKGSSSADKEMEREADTFAASMLVPSARLAEFMRANGGIVSKAAIRAFAGRIGVAPGVVVGQLQQQRALPHSHCNDLKVRIADDVIDKLTSSCFVPQTSPPLRPRFSRPSPESPRFLEERSDWEEGTSPFDLATRPHAAASAVPPGAKRSLFRVVALFEPSRRLGRGTGEHRTQWG